MNALNSEMEEELLPLVQESQQQEGDATSSASSSCAEEAQQQDGDATASMVEFELMYNAKGQPQVPNFHIC